MKKKSIPFGGAMKMKVAFCNGIGIDTSQIKRLIWISGQLSFDEKENFIGKGDMRAQTEQVLKNIKSVLGKLGGTMDDIVQVTVFVKEMGSLKDIHDAVADKGWGKDISITLLRDGVVKEMTVTLRLPKGPAR